VSNKQSVLKLDFGDGFTPNKFTKTY
jgi:hypothetical protein